MLILTINQQEKMAGHVQYEIDEFRNSFQELFRLKGRKNSAWNRALESVLLHFRNLRTFFFGERTRAGADSDVFATHFISGWKHQRDCVFDTTSKRLNKRLVHLTIERLEPDSDWPELDKMNAAIETLISEFKKPLSPTQASWFPRLDKPTVENVLGAADMLGAADNSTASGPSPSLGPLKT